MAPDVVLRRGAQRRARGAPRARGARARRRPARRGRRVRRHERVARGRCSRAGFAALFDLLPLDRVVLELSEHDPVATTRRWRPRSRRTGGGMRLAIDDVGAGFSSLRHIVVTAPDVIKLDRSIVDGVDLDPVLTQLVRSLVDVRRAAAAPGRRRGHRDRRRRRRPVRPRRRLRAGLVLRPARARARPGTVPGRRRRPDLGRLEPLAARAREVLVVSCRPTRLLPSSTRRHACPGRCCCAG